MFPLKKFLELYLHKSEGGGGQRARWPQDGVHSSHATHLVIYHYISNTLTHVCVQEAWKGLDEENRWKLLAMATAAAAAHHLHTEDSVDV